MSISERNDRKYLLELAKQYPSRKAAAAEIIRLNGLLNLPKGTEHFLSDIHAFQWQQAQILHPQGKYLRE